MKQKITKRLIEYLQLDTNYAVIINGNYGIGKTHYIKNELFSKVRKLEVPDSKKDEKFTPILVSLFGVKSIEDIQSQIFIELFPILKNRGLKIAAGLGNGILKFFNNDLKELISDSGAIDGSFTDYKKVLICIDDIDRKGSELEIQEVFGFVNNLVENFGAKIILIANEDELRHNSETKRNSYALIREKVIGVSVSYKLDLSLTFEEIVKSKYKDKYPSYYNYLIDNKTEIIRIIELNNDNLRNLLFFLEHFKIIFRKLRKYFTKESSLKEFEKEIFDKILSFTLPISFEYKSGNLQPNNFEEIREVYSSGFFNISAFLIDNPQEKLPSSKDNIKPYNEVYKERYFDQKEQGRNFLFNSIFNYITGESAFDLESLIAEINSFYKIEDAKIPEREVILGKLSYWKCIDLPEEEYRNLTNEMLDLADNSKYSIEQYPTIFHYASRFENLLKYDLDKLVKRLKKAIEKGDFEYKDSLHFHLSMSTNSEYYEKLKEVGEFCFKKNESIKVENECAEMNKLFKLFKSDFNSFLETIVDKNEIYRFSPIFLKINFSEFFKAIKELSNSEIIEFAFVLKRRYSKHLYPELITEKEFLIKLEKKISAHIKKSTTRKLDKVAFEFFKNQINESLNNFE